MIGCKLPGKEAHAESVFRLTSPSFTGESSFIRNECPTSLVLRTTPQVYSAIATESYVELGAVDPLALSLWAQRSMAAVSGERGRLMELKSKSQSGNADSKYGERVRGKR